MAGMMLPEVNQVMDLAHISQMQLVLSSIMHMVHKEAKSELW